MMNNNPVSCKGELAVKKVGPLPFALWFNQGFSFCNALFFLVMLCLLLSSCGHVRKPKGGGYYQNDGPGHVTVLTDEQLKDAVPRVDPLMSGPNKPYTVKGRRYTPDTREIPFKQKGYASWYGRQFHGRQTSSGEVYDMYAMTAAHTTLPIPCYVRVTNLKNAAQVIVRVNDRGPFHDDRIIDLSYAAAYKLGYINTGTAQVLVERIMPEDIRAGRVAGTGSAPARIENTAGGLGTFEELNGGYYLQVATFSTAERAQVLINTLSRLTQVDAPVLLRTNGHYYRVYIGPLLEESRAKVLAYVVKRYVGEEPLLLDRR